jgi:hypothetical protein
MACQRFVHFFSIRLITFNLSPLPSVFSQYFTWIAPGDVDLHLSLILERKANAVEDETK